MDRSALIKTFVCLLVSFSAYSQSDGFRYVDFHIHTTMKNYYRDIKHPDSMLLLSRPEAISTNNWNGHSTNKKKKLYKFSGFNGEPQASFDVLQNSNASILCTCITPIEEKATSKRTVPLLGFIPVRFRWINKTFVTKLNKKRLKVIEDSSSYGYNEFLAEYKFLSNQSTSHPEFAKKVILAKNADDLKNIRANNDIGMVLTIEGAHVLFGKSRATPEETEKSLIDSVTLTDMLQKVDTIKNLEHRVFFIAPGHLFWNGITGYAKGLDTDALNGFGRKILNFSAGVNLNLFRKIFTKYGDGIIDTIYNYSDKTSSPCVCKSTYHAHNNDAGKKIIKSFLAENGLHNKRVFIDLRHMDVQGREDYWQLLQEEYPKDSIPIIISHAAVNGKSLPQAKFYGSCPHADRYTEIISPKKFYKKQVEYHQCHQELGIPLVDLENKSGWFHPWSINLYDEEIERVYKTNGIIGVSMEERALGKGRPNYKEKQYRKDSKQFLKARGYNKEEIKTFRIMEPFMRNVLYIVEHSGFAGRPKSWQHIALGSDFDGIINSVDACPTSAYTRQYFDLMVKNLPVLAALTKKEYLLCDKTEILMNQLFSRNGERFIEKHF